MKQSTALFAILRRCLHLIDQKLLLKFSLIYADMDTVLSSKSTNWLLSNVAISFALNSIFVNTRYIIDYFKANQPN